MRIVRFVGKNEYMSNFYLAPFFFAGYEWSTVEHAFQAYKSRERVIREHIMRLPTPGAAKKAGRTTTMRKDWPEIRQLLMTQLVRAKFIQYLELAQKLLETGDAEIVEGNTWHDNEWGDCDCSRCKDIEGENMLGEILMKVRAELREIRVCQQ